MKVLGYTPNIKLAPAGSPNIQTSRDINAYGGNQAGMNMMTESLGKAINLADKLADEKMTADVMSANTEYQKRLNDALYGEKGLMTRQQDGASNITNEFQEMDKKIRGDISEQWKFATPRARRAFEVTSNRDAASRYELVRKHQFLEEEKYKDTALNNNLYEISNFAGKNYSDDTILSDTLNNGNNLIAARYASQGAEVVKAGQVKFKSEMLTSALTAAVTADDYNAVMDIAGKYGEYIPADILAKSLKFSTTTKNNNDAILTYEKLYAQYGDNIEAGQAAIKTSSLYSTTNSTGSTSFEAFLRGVEAQESGGNHLAENARTGAHGLFQIMPENWEPWSQEILGYVADRNDPNAQKKIAAGKLRKYYDKYGAEGALVAWYAGEQNGQRWKDENPTALGEGGQYSWDAKQGAGDEPSIREYVQNVLARVGSIPSSRTKSPKEQQELLDGYTAFVQKKASVQAIQDRNNLKAGEKTIWQAIDNGVNDPKQLESIARKHSNGNVNIYKDLMQDVSFLFENKKTAMSDQAKMRLADMIDTGLITDRDVLKQQLMQNGSYENVKEFLNMFDTNQKKEDRYSFDWNGIKQQAFAIWGNKDESIWFHAKAAGNEFISEYKRGNNGALPSQHALQQKIIEAGTKPNTGIFGGSTYKTLWENKGLSQADMRMMGLVDVRSIIKDGKKIIRLYGEHGTSDISEETFIKMLEVQTSRKEIK